MAFEFFGQKCSSCLAKLIIGRSFSFSMLFSVYLVIQCKWGQLNIWQFMYCLIFRPLVILLPHSMALYYMPVIWKIIGMYFVKHVFLLFTSRLSYDGYWIPFTRKCLLLRFIVAVLPPLPLWFKMILLDLLNSIKLSSCYDLYIWLICYLRHINYPIAT